MSDAKLAAAIRQAVEVQGVPWSGRGRIGTPDGLADQLVLALAAAPDMAETNCVAAMISESAQESDWFCSLVEYGGASARYAPYYGRGLIQLTWEVNFRGMGQWCKSLGLVSDSEVFVKNPDLVTQWPFPWLTTVYYFTRHINAAYWRSKNWNAISGLINAGSASYYVPAYELRSKSINAALAQLAGWAYTGGDTMPTAQEIADAVWAHQIKMYGRSPNTGKTVSAGTVMGWLDDQFNNIPDNVWNKKVTRAGLPSDDPRAGKQVSTGTIMAYMDAFVADVKNSIVEAVKLIRKYTDPGTVEAAEDAANVYIIQKGDTLKAVAEAHGVTVADIVAVNGYGFDSNGLVVGQKIIIPTTTTTQEAAA